MKYSVRTIAAVVSAGLAATALATATPWPSAAAAGSDRPGPVARSSTRTPSAVVPGTVYGPSGAPACSGVAIRPGQEAQSVIERYAAGTVFCFAAGLHRVTRTLLPKAGMTLGSSARAVLSGSVRLSTWTATGGDWVTRGALPPAYPRAGQCEDNVANICGLREQLFANGVHVRRVATRALVVPGTFYADYGADAIYVGTDPRGRAMEMSRTATAIAGGSTRVTVRGLTVEHFASTPQRGAVVIGTSWTVYSNDIRHNHAVGIMLADADNASVSRNLVHNNGQLGIGQSSTVGAKIATNYLLANNTDGFWIGDWEAGGFKSTGSTGGSVINNLIRSNRGIGLWSDAYDQGRTFAGNRIEYNAADGIRFELGRNSAILSNTVIGNGLVRRRGSGTSLWDGAGINVNTAWNMKVQGNFVDANFNGISLQARSREPGPWGANLLRDVLVSGNTVRMRAGSQATGIVQNANSPLPAGEAVYRSNKYLLDSLAAKRFNRYGVWHTAGTWRATGQDVGSTFVAAP